MTKEEAKITLANLKRYMSGGGAVDRNTNKAIDMAIEALGKPEPHWIPCSERLPDKEGNYLVTDDAGGMKTIEVDTLLHYEDDGKPFWCYSQNPIAWRELPEPYKGVTT